MRTPWSIRIVVGSCLCAVVWAGCGEDENTFLRLSGTPAQRSVIVFNAENNRLHAYDPADGFRKQTVIPSHADDPNGRDVNGQICFLRDGSRRFIAGEDTNQPNPLQGWGIFQLHGQQVGELSAPQIGKLTPTYQATPDNAENYGCGILSDGRVLTTDVGDQASGPPNGQLIIWFPPFDSFAVRYCKLDIGIGTAGGIFVDAQDRVYAASNRTEGAAAAGIYRYTGPFPTSDDVAGGCDSHDSTGAPLATGVHKEIFILHDNNASYPSAIVQSPQGTFYVSSVLNGIIAEYDAAGHFMRRILQRAPGDNTAPFATGTPFGLGIDASGTVYYADIGIVIAGLDIGPGPQTGSVRRLRFVDGVPQPPETMDSRLDFPDGIGVLEE